MLPMQLEKFQSSLNPISEFFHTSSVGVARYKGCKTLHSSTYTSFTMLEIVARMTRKKNLQYDVNLLLPNI